MLVTGQELAINLGLTYAADPFDQVAGTADEIVGRLLTPLAYANEPIPAKEAALHVATEIFQARYSAGGESIANDFTPGPYRLSSAMTRRVMALLGPYLDPKGMVG